MSYLWHTLMSYIWGVLFVLGVIVGGILWLGMAVWDGVRRLFRRIGGEVDHPQDTRPR